MKPTVAAGSWDNTATWNGGTVPTASDNVVIRHAVYLNSGTTAVCNDLSIQAGGALYFHHSVDVTASTASLTVSGDIKFYGGQDIGIIRTDGMAVTATPGIYCSATFSGKVPRIEPLVQGSDVIIEDPGYISAGCTLQDIKPEGCARAYARKISNNVRYATLTVRIRASKVQLVGLLLRMAEGPYPVLLVTNTYMMKGFIETMATDASSVGREHIVYKVTIAEAF